MRRFKYVTRENGVIPAYARDEPLRFKLIRGDKYSFYERMEQQVLRYPFYTKTRAGLEQYYYAKMLEHVAYRGELLSHNNKSRTYHEEAILRGIDENMELEFIENIDKFWKDIQPTYAHLNLYVLQHDNLRYKVLRHKKRLIQLKVEQLQEDLTQDTSS